MRLLVFSLIVLSVASCGGKKADSTPKVTNIDSLVKLYPDSVEILIQHGNVLLDRYDYENALKEGAKA